MNSSSQLVKIITLTAFGALLAGFVTFKSGCFSGKSDSSDSNNIETDSIPNSEDADSQKIHIMPSSKSMGGIIEASEIEIEEETIEPKNAKTTPKISIPNSKSGEPTTRISIPSSKSGQPFSTESNLGKKLDDMIIPSSKSAPLFLKKDLKDEFKLTFKKDSLNILPSSKSGSIFTPNQEGN